MTQYLKDVIKHCNHSLVKMNRQILKIYSFILVILSLASVGCTDDFGYWGAEDLDGEATLTLDAGYSPFSDGNLTRSEGNGKILSEIKDLCLLVYDENGNILDESKYPLVVDLTGLKIEDDSRDNKDASNGKSAETTTKTVKGISLKLPFGTYYIVGVANLKGGTYSTLTKGEEYKTLQTLRRMKINWNNEADQLSQNGELMGYFTDTDLSDINTDVPAYDRPFKKVSVNRPGMMLHAWLRRCASKITIDFDGSGLRENVSVYIKDAKIYDIAYDCTLGFGGKMAISESEATYNHSVKSTEETADGMYRSNQQVITYSEGEDYTNWKRITKGMPVLKNNTTDEGYADAGVINFHDESMDALYFYENMQDNPDGKSKIPLPDMTDAGVRDEDVQKDGIEYGTYIEVTGYYISDADGNSTYGHIKYRFMIGKDEDTNFEAERNYHYKLTLKPLGNGNDYDWHIDFKEPKGFHVPNPWYVSYLYNHDAVLPFKYVPEDDDYEVVGLEAKITTNPWYPVNYEREKLEDNTIDLGNDAAYDVNTYSGDANSDSEYKLLDNKHNGNGFLSLRASSDLYVTLDDVGLGEWQYGNNGTYTIQKNASLNDNYYFGRTAGTGHNIIDRSKREYMKDGEIYDEDEYITDSERATYQKKGNTWSFNIPLFTREKALVKQTGYSGNNPFVGYERVARVELTVKLRNKNDHSLTDEKSDYVNVVQVRRLVNPKGVYRDFGNNEPFHVTLKWLDGDDYVNFTDLISYGPWKAEIIGDPNFITLDGKQSVSGSSGTPVDFTIRFNRMNNDRKVRYAGVRVKYHNYTCTHIIFVRQGYTPDELHPGSSKWGLFNMVADGVLADDPREEGSLFKYGNLKEPIDAINNVYKYADMTTPIDANNVSKNDDDEDYRVPKDFSNTKELKPGSLIITNSDGSIDNARTMEWSSIGNSSGENAKFSDNDIATMQDFQNLYRTENMQFGFGVLYADGATETQNSIYDAYGYCRHDKSANAKEKGMRGLFAYYWDGDIDGNSKHSEFNAHNIFFPIGRAGFGHRKNKKEGANGDQNGYGILRYSCQRGASNYGLFAYVAPLFVSIYRSNGAIYYCREISGTEWQEWDGSAYNALCYGLDINYFSFDVNLISYSNVDNGGDACFVRSMRGK